MSQTTYLSFTQSAQAGEVFIAWWRRLEEDRGERARLRRCKETIDVVFCEGYQQLRLKLLPMGRVLETRLCLLAGVASHVREHQAGASLVEQMASSVPGREGATISGLRFRRLLAVEEPAQLFTPMVRVVRQLQRRVNLHALAADLYHWNRHVRSQWAQNYYGKASKEA